MVWRIDSGAQAVLGAGRMADKGEIISVWRVVSPPGYGSLGDVVSLGLDPPTAPVTVSLAPCEHLQLLICVSRPKRLGLMG